MEKRCILTVQLNDMLVEILETKAATASSWGAHTAHIVVNPKDDGGGEIVLRPSQIHELINLLNVANSLYRR